MKTGGGDAARGDDDQPLGRRRPRRLHAGPVRGGDGLLAARRRLSQRLEDRRAHGREPALRGDGRRLDSSSPTPARRTPSARCSPSTWSPRRRSAGILVKVAGRLDADPASGRLIATFDDLPQLPYTHFNVHFREGQRSPLATPSACGTYTTEIDLSPWRDPGSVRHADSAFALASRRRRRPLPRRRRRPFAPQAKAGTLNSQRRLLHPLLPAPDPAPTPSRRSPPTRPPCPRACSASIAGDPLLPGGGDRGGQAAAAASPRRRSPSCPAASRDRPHRTPATGSARVLAYAPGGLYLAGPYHGSPLSIVAIDSATVGPFDLGTVVIRSAIRVDPRTAQVSIDSAGSDPIPHILDGIPLHLRDIRVYIDRPGFTLNPTSCDPFAVTSTLTGSGRPLLRTRPTTPPPPRASALPGLQLLGSLGFNPKLAPAPARRHQTRRLPRPAGDRHGPARATPTSAAPRSPCRPRSSSPRSTSRRSAPARQFAARSLPDGLGLRPRPAPSRRCSTRRWKGPVYLRSSDNPLPDLVAALRGGGTASRSTSSGGSTPPTAACAAASRSSPTRR